MSNTMETDTNQSIAPGLYSSFRGYMLKLFEDNGVAPKYHAVEYNANLFGGIVCAYIVNFNKTNPLGDGKADEKKYHYYKVDFDIEAKTTKVETVEFVLKTALMKAKMDIDKLGDNEERKKWFPFLASLQLCNKTRDSILWQNSKITSSLEVPSACEPFAFGHNIHDRLKKARRRSLGPLVHINSVLRLKERISNKKRGMTLSKDNVRAIINDTRKVLKKQSISLAQKKMIDEILDGDETYVSTLCISYLSIKPHVEHDFMLTYPVIAVTEDFEGATYSSEWVFKTFQEGISKVIFIGESMEWTRFLAQIQVHCSFQSSYEDLTILEHMFAQPFYMRKEFGRYQPAAAAYVSAGFDFKYKFWAKPQRGAPRNIESVRSGQICTKPSFRGMRHSFNAFNTIEEVKNSYLAAGTTSLKEALEADFEAYKKLEKEGTGIFMEVGSTNEYKGTTSSVPAKMLFQQ